MAKKQFTYDDKQVVILKNGEFWLEAAIATACNHSEICNELNTLTDENEQLKKRNTNQYNQLNQLWQLIEAKDWETLTAMNNQMKEDEERLRNEWKCYE